MASLKLSELLRYIKRMQVSQITYGSRGGKTRKGGEEVPFFLPVITNNAPCKNSIMTLVTWKEELKASDIDIETVQVEGGSGHLCRVTT